MSDPKYGDPVDDAAPADEVTPDDAVARANEGLAEAEAVAAAADDTNDDAPYQVTWAADEPEDAVEAASAVETSDPDDHEGLSPADAALYEQAMAEAALGEPAPATEPPAAPTAATEAYAAPAAVEPAVVPSEPTLAIPPAVVAPQPIFVQAPEPPLPRGNRGAAGAIGLLAAIVFGVLYLGAATGLAALDGDVTGDQLGSYLLGALASWWLWIPVAVYFIGFWLLGAIINRGRWGYWVHFGLLTGAAAYGGHILGQLFQAPFWTLTASEGAQIANEQLFAPLAIAAFIFGREITIWFGAWVAARGKRVSELNYEAQREYERTLEAGPRIQQG